MFPVVALVAVLVVVIVVLAYRLGSVTAAGSQAAATASPSPSASPLAPSVSDVFSLVAPSVVVVRTPDGLGTGVIVAEDATILTAHHVIEDAAQITVTYWDGTSTEAAVAWG